MENLRVSSYMIPVKLEDEREKYLLIQGYTGAIDVVEKDFLERIKSSIDSFSPETSRILCQRGYITSKTEEEEYAYAARLAEALHKKDSILHKSFMLIVTYHCNFRCPYCFENRETKDDGCSITFTKTMVDRAFQAMDAIEPAEELRNRTIILYGGEPLLKENKDVVTYIVETGRKRGYKFYAITNGYDIEYFSDLLREDAIYKLQITIDGMKELHNQRRVHYKNGGTFDKIIANIRLALEKDIQVQVRVNTDHYNIEEFIRLKEYFEQKGFLTYKQFKLYSTPLRNNTNTSEEEKESLGFLRASSFFEKHKEMKTLSLCHDNGIFRNIYQSIIEKRPLHFRSVNCTAQTNGYAFDPLGMIYPCWEVVGNTQFSIGNYLEVPIQWNKEMKDLWHTLDVSKASACRRCKYAFLCGGGCPAHTFEGKTERQCVFFRQAFEIAVNRAYKQLV